MRPALLAQSKTTLEAVNAESLAMLSSKKGTALLPRVDGLRL